MSNTITIRPEPHRRETLFSLISRTAAMRRLSAWELTSELGMPQKSLIAGDSASVGRFFGTMALNAKVRAEILSWTPQPLVGVRMQFRGEVVVSRAVMNPVVRGCPKCLREDASRSQFETTDGMVMRGDWQFRHVSMCIQHASPLVPLWTAKRLAERYDYAAQLRRIGGNLLNGELDAPNGTITSYDKWVDSRLESGIDKTWLAAHSIDVVAQFCTLLGSELVRRGLAERCGATSIEARAVGFDVASRGPAAITETFELMSDHATGAHDELRKAFGDLYNWLAHTAAGDPRYDPFRDLMRKVVLDVWPLPAGTKVLGATLPNRNRHSVLTAAAEARVSPARMRSLLTAEGIVEEGDARPDARVTFPSYEVEPLLGVFRRLVGTKAMQKRLGCGVQQLEALAEAGLVSPRVPLDATRRPWDPVDAELFVEKILSGASDISAEETDWEHIHRAAQRCRVSIEKVVRSVLNGTLKVGHKTDLRGYASIFVLKSEVNHFVRPPRPEHQTLSEFATSVGLNKHREFRLLSDAGHTPVTILYNPQTHRHDRYVTQEDARAFHERFTTLKLLSVTTGFASRAISQRLKASGVTRFQPDGSDFGPVYLKEDIEHSVIEFSLIELAEGSQ
ncbi:TniQ family protein [Aliiroseovarius sp. S1339]|nr:TniQ family protein [Aliiroseovarius sp. S1339]